MKRSVCLSVLWGILLLLSSRAEAQINHGDLRLTLDTDVISVAGVKIDPEGPGSAKSTVFGIGPNQLGGAQEIPPTPATPLGFGLGYALSSELVLGVRTGLGFDIIKPENGQKTKALAISLMPGITWVPIGRQAKLFINGSAIFQADRVKTGGDKARTLLGGFAAGIGTLIFPSNSFSVDLGFFFEARFGKYRPDDDNDAKAGVQDLRGVIRLGFSLWK